MFKKGYKQTPEHKEKIRAFHLGKKLSEETKKKLSDSHKGKTPTKGKHWKLSEETKMRIGLANKGKTRTEEQKQEMSRIRKGLLAGEKHPNWMGGKSFELYTVDWTETLRVSIRERDRYICKTCGKKQGDIAHDIHHIDYDKKNCNPDNLITLCHSCHTKTNFNRKYWINYYDNKAN